LSRLVAELIQATADAGTQWILDLSNGTVKESCITEDWKKSVVLQIYRGKGYPMECGSKEELNCWNKIVGTCYETGGKDIRTQTSTAD